jgi:hypothetical protein
MKNFLVEKVRIVDIIIVIGVIAALAVGFFTYKNFRQTASNQVEKTAKIAFQVFLRGVTITGKINPIKIGDDTFISIRNVPYTDLKVIDVKTDTKKTIMPNPKGNPAFLLVEDYSQVFMYDIVVTVVDTAQITKDGAVIGGNKIKIGLPITLEGKNYKFNGTVSNIEIIPDDVAKKLFMQPTATPQATAPAQPNPAVTIQAPVGPVKK